MGNTTKEKLTFSAMMTFGMVLIMVSFNVIRAVGFNSTAAIAIATSLLPVFLVAFAVEMLVVSHNVKKVHKIIVAPDDPQFKHIIVMSSMMVVGMCVAMSLYATLVNHGTGPTFWADYIRALGINLPVAFVAQLLVVGPLVRMLHLQIFKNSQLSE